MHLPDLDNIFFSNYLCTKIAVLYKNGVIPVLYRSYTNPIPRAYIKKIQQSLAKNKHNNRISFTIFADIKKITLLFAK